MHRGLVGGSRDGLLFRPVELHDWGGARRIPGHGRSSWCVTHLGVPDRWSQATAVEAVKRRPGKDCVHMRECMYSGQFPAAQRRDGGREETADKGTARGAVVNVLVIP